MHFLKKQILLQDFKFIRNTFKEKDLVNVKEKNGKEEAEKK